ncbi:MAG: aspartate/tyrosine/aromatic aminotransferase [Rubritepida sp.]|nr:aspartate/tyrosine/aromatic aminotransferase [Rubritepida sp.]
MHPADRHGVAPTMLLRTLHAPPPLAPTATALDAPPIPASRAWAERYVVRAEAPVIDLTQGVPNTPPDPGLLRRLGKAGADRALASYGPLEGEPALREAFAVETRRLYGGDVAAADVTITAGANLGFTLVMSAITTPGDAVLLPAPWFFNHPMALALRGVASQPLPCDAGNGLLPDPDRAAALIDARTRAIVLVTPNNPTGAIMPPALVARFAALCRDRGLWLVLDETYRDFLPAGAGAPHGLFAQPGWRDHVVQLYSFSKAYGIPGHRSGAVVAGPLLRAQLMKAVDNIQICAPRPPQVALAWAIPALRVWREDNAAAMARRGAAFAAALREAPTWRIEALGAYFAWVRIPEAMRSAAQAAETLAQTQGVITLPGTAFGPGGERHLRMAFAGVEEAAIAALPARLNAITEDGR